MEQRGQLTRQQVERGMKPVRADRLEVLKGLSYVPAEEVRAELTRQFGVGSWDSQVVDLTLLFENTATSKAGSEVWDVCYRAGVQLRVRDYDGRPIAEFIEYHMSSSRHPDRGEAHGNAMTAASSYALRRCAIGLGDNYGLHLYAKGSTDPLVRGTLQLTEHLKPADAPEKPAEPGAAPADPQQPAPAATEAAAAQVAKAFAR